MKSVYTIYNLNTWVKLLTETVQVSASAVIIHMLPGTIAHV